MKTFTMVCDEAQQAIRQIGARAIADPSRVVTAIGQKAFQEHRQAMTALYHRMADEASRRVERIDYWPESDD